MRINLNLNYTDRNNNNNDNDNGRSRAEFPKITMSILEYGENCLYLKGILDDQTPHILTPTSNLCLALDLYYLSSSSHHVGSNICKRSGSSVLSRTWQMTRSRIHFSRIPPTIQSTFLPPELYFIKFNKFDQIVLFTCTNWQYILMLFRLHHG